MHRYYPDYCSFRMFDRNCYLEGRISNLARPQDYIFGRRDAKRMESQSNKQHSSTLDLERPFRTNDGGSITLGSRLLHPAQNFGTLALQVGQNIYDKRLSRLDNGRRCNREVHVPNYAAG